MMKRSFIANMLGIFCGIFAVAVLGSVEITVSATLVRLLPAGLLFVASAACFSVGLAPEKTRRTHHTQSSVTSRAVPLRRAA